MSRQAQRDADLRKLYRALRRSLPWQHTHILAQRVYELRPPGATVDDVVRIGREFPRVRKVRRNKRERSPFDALRID